MALRTVGVRLVAEISGYRNQLRAAAISTKEFTSGLDTAAKAGKLDKLADQAGRMGLGMVAAFGIAVGAAARFDKQMSEVAAVSNATGGELNKLRQAALQAGKDTAFSATEAAKAEAELAKAGLGTADILGGALKGSLSLAAAGTLDLAEAADISAKTMNVFNLKGKDVGHIADVLAASANKSATDVHEMGEALRMGGLAANAAGMSLEETSGTLAAFADNALVGSDAGTSLKTMLQMLAAPSDKAAALMQELGIQAYDAAGNFVGTARLAGNLQAALGNLTMEQRNAALATIFGADAMRSANILFGLGERGVRDYVAAVNDQGAAAEVAAKKMDNLAGDVEKLKGSLETMAIESGSGANSGLRQLVKLADGLVKAFSALPGPVQSSLVMLTGLSGAALLAFAAFVKMRRASAEALAELRAMGPAGATAAAGLERASRAAKIAGAAFIALEVVDAVISELRNSSADIDKLTSSIEELGKTGKRSGELARIFGKDSDDFKAKGQQFRMAADGWVQDTGRITEKIPVIGSFGRAWNQAFGQPTFLQAQENVKALDMQLAEFASTTDDVSQAQTAYTKLLQSSGMSAEEFAKIMPKSNEALHEAWKNANNAAAAHKNLGPAVNETAKEMEDAAKKAEELKDAYDKLFGVTMGIDRAQIAYREGLKELDKELKSGKRTLDINTQAGRDNSSAVLDQIQKINDLRQANIDNGMSVEDANKKYGDQIGSLRKTLIQMGYLPPEVDKLIGKYRAIPNNVYTAAHLDTRTAKQKADDLKKYLHKIPDEDVNIALRVTGSKNASAAAAAIRKQYANAKGGVINTTGAGFREMAEGGMIATGPTVLFGERQTKRELYLPQEGISQNRAAELLSIGAGWHGMKVAPQAAPMAYAMGPKWSAQPLKIQGNAMADMVFEWLRNEVRRRGGELAVLNLKAPA